MTTRDKQLIRARIKTLERERYKFKDEALTPLIKTLKLWLQGEPKKPLQKTMTKDEFLYHMGIDTSNPPGEIELTSRKQVDDIWGWLKTANIQVKAQEHIKRYFIQKLKQERIK